MNSRTDFSNQRPAFAFSPPAIIRHLMFRIPTDKNPRMFAAENKRIEAWDSIANNFQGHINSLREDFRKSRNVIILNPMQESNEINGEYSLKRSAIINICDTGEFGYTMKARIDVYTEVYSITYCIEMIDPDSDNFISQGIKRLYTESESKLGINSLHGDLWDKDEVDFSKTIRRWLKEQSESDRGHHRKLLADFRGIIIGKSCQSKFETFGKSDSNVLVDIDDQELKPDLVSFIADHPKLFNAVTTSHTAKSPKTSGSEVVLCGMIGGRAVYATELGQWGGGLKDIQPIKYLVVYDGNSPAQIGRLVRRLHVLGEFRHAALMDYDNGAAGNDIKYASRKLHELGRSIDEFFFRPKKEKLNDDLDINSSSVEISLVLSRIQSINRLISDMAEISGTCDGGLTYRIEQSRYYADEFKNSLRHLRIVRVGFWQPYDDFVSRYILQLFARIDRVGHRYEAVGRRLARILSAEEIKLNALEVKYLNEYYNKIDLGINNLNRSTRDLNSVSKSQEGLLLNAERAAFFVLFYYTFSAINTSISKKDIIPYSSLFWFNFIWCSVLLLATIWLLFRIAVPLFKRAHFEKASIEKGTGKKEEIEHNAEGTELS